LLVDLHVREVVDSMTARASLTRAETNSSRAAWSSQAMRGLPASSQSWAWQCSAMNSAAPGTSRRTRRMAAINWVIVSWVATASSRTTESSARRVRPFSTPVAATTPRTASKMRCGDRDSRRRLRQYVSVVGCKPS
jgi:hypothetical protein